MINAYASAMGHVFLVAAPLLLVGFVLTLFLKEVRLSPLVGKEREFEAVPFD